MDSKTRAWFDDVVTEHISPMFAEFEITTEPIGIRGEGLAAVIGFAGRKLHGTLGVIGPVATLEQLMPDEVGGGEVSDLVGELANRALGRLKFALCKAGVDVWSTTPVAMTGISLGVVPSERVRTFTFRRCEANLHLWVDCASSQPLPPDPADAPEELPLEAGDSLFF